jgi:hypothetical protein
MVLGLCRQNFEASGGRAVIPSVGHPDPDLLLIGFNIRAFDQSASPCTDTFSMYEGKVCHIQLVFNGAGHMNGPVTRNIPPAPAVIELLEHRNTGRIGDILPPPAPDPALNLSKRQGLETELFWNAALDAQGGDMGATTLSIEAKAMKGTLETAFNDLPLRKRGAEMWTTILGHQEAAILQATDHPWHTEAFKTAGLMHHLTRQKEGVPEVLREFGHGHREFAMDAGKGIIGP